MPHTGILTDILTDIHIHTHILTDMHTQSRRQMQAPPTHAQLPMPSEPVFIKLFTDNMETMPE